MSKLAYLRARLRKASQFRPLRLARVVVTRPLGARGKRRVAVLLAGLFAILVWQNGFSGVQTKTDSTYKITAASGVHYDRNFVYFLYYLNLFPVVSTANPGCVTDTVAGCWDTAGTPAEYTYEGAKRILTTKGKTLQQDLGWTWEAGDRGKIYLYLFDAWLKGAPWNPSPIPSSRLAFTVSLLLLFASTWWVRRPIVGAALVVFLGSNPFQVYEVHGHENVFGWNITTAILLLAIHLPLFQRYFRPHPRWIFAWPVGVGILLATIRTVRSEPATMMLAVVGTYALIHLLSWKKRALMIAALAATFWLTGTAWNAHFTRQQKHAGEVIASHGGHPFPSDIRLYHHVWHPIFCGLGDFGQKYGYEWNDHTGAAYAKPFLEAKGIFVPSGNFADYADPREYMDAEKLYKKLPYDIPEYNDIIRDHILHDIKSDPKWYLGVLAKRVGRIFGATTPIRITWPTGWINVPWNAVLVLPLALALLALRQRFYLGLTLFTTPLLTTALLIYSDRGITYYGIFHIVGFAILVTFVVAHAVYWAVRGYRRARRPKEVTTDG